MKEAMSAYFDLHHERLARYLRCAYVAAHMGISLGEGEERYYDHNPLPDTWLILARGIERMMNEAINNALADYPEEEA